MGWYGRNINGQEVVIKNRVKDVLWGEDPPRFKLRPCPRCGAIQEPDRRVDSVYFGFCEGKDGWKVTCRDCELETRFYREEIDAVREWNGDEKT